MTTLTSTDTHKLPTTLTKLRHPTLREHRRDRLSRPEESDQAAEGSRRSPGDCPESEPISCRSQESCRAAR
jgi:hypothetical protein